MRVVKAAPAETIAIRIGIRDDVKYCGQPRELRQAKLRMVRATDSGLSPFGVAMLAQETEIIPHVLLCLFPFGRGTAVSAFHISARDRHGWPRHACVTCFPT
jgi:hypothetical protein